LTVNVKFTLPVGVVIVSVCGPAATLLGTVMLAVMVEPSPVTFEIVAVIPAGPVIPVAPSKFCPLIVTGVVAP